MRYSTARCQYDWEVGVSGLGGNLRRICRTINLTMVIIPSIIHRHRHDEHFLQHHHDHHEEGMFVIIIVISRDHICYKQYKQCLYKIIITRVKVGWEVGLGFWCVVCESEGPHTKLSQGAAGSGRAVRSKHQTCSLS